VRIPIGISALLHIAFIAVLILGVPWFRSEPQEPTPPAIEVQFAEVTEKTTPPPPKPAPEVKPEPPKPEPPKPVAKAEPPKPAPLPQPPTPEAKPEPKVEAPEPEPLPVPKPQEAPKKITEAPPTPPQVVPTPKAKPAPPKPAFDPTKLAALLDKRIKTSSPPTPEAPAQKLPQIQVATPSIDPAQRLTVSEIDLIRAQIIANWFPPFGAKDAADMEVYVRIALNPDGTLAGNPTVTRTSQVSKEQMQPFVESTLRAILKSQPLKVPPGKYESFRDITLRFNMKDMLGG